MLINILIMLILLWVCIYTFSFAVWTWRHKNRFGAFIVMCIAIMAVVLPFLDLFVI